MARRTTPAPPRRDLAIAAIAAVLIGALGPRVRAVHPDQELARAILASQSGHPDDALRSIERVLEFEPALASLHTAAARLSIASGSSQDAFDHLRAARAAGLEGPSADCLEVQAFLLASPASEIPSYVPEGCVPQRGTMQRRVESLLRDGDSVSAQDTLAWWLRQNPDDLTAWEDLAGLAVSSHAGDARPIVLEALQNHPSGSPLLDGLVALLPDAPGNSRPAETCARVGELYAANGRWAVAAQAWSDALEAQPSFPQALAYLGMARTRLGWDGLASLQQAASEAPQDPIVRSLLGQVLLQQGEIERAQSEIGYARQLDPRNPAIAAAHGQALAATGDYQGAASEYLRAAELAPRAPSFWLLLSRFSLEYDFEVDTLGLAAARNAAALEPRDASALSALGYAWHVAGDSHLAGRLLLRSLNLDPADALTWYRYGLVALDSGLVAEAEAAMAAAVALDPGGPTGALAERTRQAIRGKTG